MNIQRIDSAKSNPNFGTLYPGVRMPIDKYNRLSKIPAIADFSKKFDGFISIGHFMSSRSDKTQFSLEIREIEPMSFLTRIKSLFFKTNSKELFILKTHATTFDELEASLSKKPKNILSRMFFNQD